MKNFIQKMTSKLSCVRTIPYKYRMSTIKRLYPAMLENYPFSTDLFGLQFSGNMVNYIDRMIYLTGAHEKHLLFFLRDIIHMLRQQCNSAIYFMDIGANVGSHSLYLATQVEKVFAFEPFERVRQQLEHNVSINQIKNIQIFPFGLSNVRENLSFYAGPERNLGAASFVEDHAADNKFIGNHSTQIGDEVVLEKKLAPITLIKIDVEGFEKKVIEGLQNTLNHDRPLVIFEMSQTTYKEFDGNETKIKSVFPKNYKFYYFSYGNYDSGKYQISKYDFKFHIKHQDIIAIPDEWSFL